MLQAGKPLVLFPMVIELLNLPNTSRHTMALGSAQPLTEMSTRNIPGGKKLPARKLTNLPPSVSRLSRENIAASTSHTLWDFTA
jgi:hypothetical protein